MQAHFKQNKAKACMHVGGSAHAHAGVQQRLDGGRHAVLQLILDRRHAHQLHIALHLRAQPQPDQALPPRSQSKFPAWS